MSSPILYLKNIHLNFGGTPLLEGAEISIYHDSRICLVGRNGSGKSTLMKIAAGMIEPDQGERFVQPGTRIHYLPQEPDLAGFETVEDYIKAGLGPQDDPHRAELMLERLGLTPQMKTKSLSGGEARRAAIVRALTLKPEVMLCDEPTNHLDLPAIEWLEDKMKEFAGALVLISHDRRFLENLSRETVWMDRGISRHLNKGFDAFEDWRDDLLEQEELERHKLSRKIAREEHWIIHGVSGRRKRNMRRVRELSDLKTTKASHRKATGDVTLSMAEGEISGKLVLKLFSVSKSYDSRPIVSDFSATITRGERIGIVGSNGSGKTTLVNLITGKLEPDSGKVKHGVHLDSLVIDQKRETLDPNWTLKDALTDGRGETVVIGDETKNVYSYMQDFLFLPEQARTPIRALSGGERARLTLARGLQNPSNFLVLDEPTNDLDLETLDLLQEFLADYPGTVLIVSHDREFLDRICTSIWASLGQGKWQQYAGGYSDMIAQRYGGAAPKSDQSPAIKPKKKSSNKTPASKPDPSGDKLSFKQKHALETLPAEIEKLQSEISKLTQALARPGFYEEDPKKFNAWASELEKREASLSSKEEEWLELEILAETLEKKAGL